MHETIGGHCHHAITGVPEGREFGVLEREAPSRRAGVSLEADDSVGSKQDHLRAVAQNPDDTLRAALSLP